MSKYLEVMRERERTCLDHAEWAPEYAAEAADWRRMAEAWEAMVDALKTVIATDEAAIKELDYAIGGYYPSPEAQAVTNQCRAALALAEPKEE